MDISDIFICDKPVLVENTIAESSSSNGSRESAKRARFQTATHVTGTFCQRRDLHELLDALQPVECASVSTESELLHADCFAEIPEESLPSEEFSSKLQPRDFSDLVSKSSTIIGSVQFVISGQIPLSQTKDTRKGRFIIWKQSNHILSIWSENASLWSCLFWTVAKSSKFFFNCTQDNFGSSSYVTMREDGSICFDFHWHIPENALNTNWFQLNAEEYRLLLSEPHKPRMTKHEKGLRIGLIKNFLSEMIPSKSLSPLTLTCPGLACDLLPYQKQTVHWMLQREGKISSIDHYLDPRWIQNGNNYYLPHKLVLSRQEPRLSASERTVNGGILCDELGLGKTLQMIALITLNPRDSEAVSTEESSRATLIVSPSTILPQWIQEIGSKAPHLACFNYKGLSAFEKEGNVSFDDLKTKFDVIITDFETLRRELHFALPDHSRSRRFERKFERKRSPLVQLDFWRLCIDEAQMVDSNSNIGKVTRMIQRKYSWALTGTPLGTPKNVEEDLEDLAYILFIEDLFHECALNMKCLTQLFKIFMRGNTKASLANQISIPPQKENVIYLTFSDEELHYYNEHRLRMWQDFNNERKLTGGESVQKQLMNTWFLRLRQTCTHPNIGRYNHQLLNKGNILTMTSFLEELIKAAEVSLRKSQRQYLALFAERGMMFEIKKIWEKAVADYEFAIHKMDSFLAKQESFGSDEIKFSWYLLRHRLYFCLASVYNEIKSQEKSTKFYEEAESIRAKLMEPRQYEVDHAVRHVQDTLKRIDFDNKFLRYSKLEAKFRAKAIVGILTCNHANSLFEALTLQSEHISKYRQLIIEISFSSLHQDYSEDAEKQQIGDVCLNYYQISIRNRKRALLGFNNNTAGDEEEEVVISKKEADSTEDTSDIPEPISFFDQVPLQNSIRTLLEKTDEIELAEAWRICLKDQLDFIDLMETDITALTRLWNKRIEFYKLLQKLSDEVAVPEISNPDERISSIDEEISSLSKRMDLESSKVRYLQNLSKDKSSGSSNARCIICYEDIHESISISITSCGHMFCHTCIRAWLSRQLKCPACKTALKKDDVKRVFTAEKPLILDTASDDVEVPMSVNSFKFPDSLPKLKNNYSSKLDIILKHVKYLTELDITVKVLVFSQWNDVLTLFQTAMTQEGISCLNGTTTKLRGELIEKFKNDLSVNVLLLNLRAQSSGLTVTEASHVIFIEPSLDKKAEMQAKGRVHRIGQTKITWVHDYIVKGTIEEEIRKNSDRIQDWASFNQHEDATEDEIIDLLNRELDMVTFL